MTAVTVVRCWLVLGTIIWAWLQRSDECSVPNLITATIFRQQWRCPTTYFEGSFGSSSHSRLRIPSVDKNLTKKQFGFRVSPTLLPDSGMPSFRRWESLSLLQLFAGNSRLTCFDTSDCTIIHPLSFSLFLLLFCFVLFCFLVFHGCLSATQIDNHHHHHHHLPMFRSVPVPNMAATLRAFRAEYYL